MQCASLLGPRSQEKVQNVFREGGRRALEKLEKTMETTKEEDAISNLFFAFLLVFLRLL